MTPRPQARIMNGQNKKNYPGKIKIFQKSKSTKEIYDIRVSVQLR